MPLYPPSGGAGGAAISAGTQSQNTGTVVFSNSNGISFGLNNGTLTATVTPGAAAGVAAASAGTQNQTSGTLNFVNSNGITIGMSGSSQLTFSHNGITTGRASNDAIGLNSALTANGVSVTANSSGLSLNFPAFLTTAALSGDTTKYAGLGFTSTTTAGTDVKGTHSTNGLSMAFPAWLTTAQAPGAYLTTARASNDAIGLNSGLTANGVSVTANSSGLSLNFPAFLTTAALSQDSSKYAGLGTTFNGANISGSMTMNTAGLQLSMSVAAPGGGGNTVTLYANSNTTQSSTGTANISSINFAGAGIASVGVTNGSVVISVPAGGGAGDGYNIVQAGSVGTTGTTWSSLSATVFMDGYGALTVSQNNSNRLGLSVPATSSLVGVSGIGISTNGSTISIYDSQYVGYLEPYKQTNTSAWVPGVGSWYFAPFVAPARMSGGRINRLFVNTSTAGIVRDITGGSYVSSSTGGKNQSFTYSNWLALYSQGTGTNSTRLESFWSNSFSFGLTHKLSVSQSGAGSSVQVTVSQSISYISEIGSDGAYTMQQFASNNNSNAAATSLASNNFDSVGVSIRNMLSNSIVMPVGFNTTIQAGNYWLAQMYSTTHNTATSGTSFPGASALIFSQLNQVGIQQVALESYRNWGSTATTARSQIFPGMGAVYTASSAAPPQYVNFSSDLARVANGIIPYFNFVNQGITK